MTWWAIAAAAAALAAAQPGAAPGAAQAAVPYASGGVGEDEIERLRALEPKFNLKLVFSLVEGNYVSDVRVVVRDAAGKLLLERLAEGPIFLAKLAPGTYSVAATYEGRTLSRSVKVGERLRTEYFRWPADPQADLPVSRWLDPGDRPAAARAAVRPARVAAAPGVVSAVSGGVGDDALAALEAKQAHYNLKLVFTLVEGNYLSDVSVVVKDAAGKTVLEHFAEGPILLARLPAGTYSVAASYDSKSQSRTVKVGERLRTEYFRWPADPQADLPVSRWLEREAEPKAKARSQAGHR